MDKGINSKEHSNKAKNEVHFSTLCNLSQLEYEIIRNESKLVRSANHTMADQKVCHFDPTQEILPFAIKV